MPYIQSSLRPRLDQIAAKVDALDLSKGELNYLITKLALGFLHRLRQYDEPIRYQYRSQVHGLLQDVAAEWYRRVMAPYEDIQCEKNGDAYANL